MVGLSRESPAKINLTLRVGEMRPDGFHEIESLVARVGLYDTVSVSPRADGRLTLACDDPSLPSDEENLALRAARRLAEVAGVLGRGAHITLQKRIPPGSGLGGGSSNAATVLGLLNELWKTAVPVDDLTRIGAEIGSDVPLFFHSPLCVVRGGGELVESHDELLSMSVVLVLPPFRLETRAVYARYDQVQVPESRPSIEAVLVAAERATTLMPLLFNDLEQPAFAANEEYAEFVGRLRREFGPFHVTGSGSGLFRLFDDAAEAEELAARVRRVLDVRTEATTFASKQGRQT